MTKKPRKTPAASRAPAEATALPPEPAATARVLWLVVGAALSAALLVAASFFPAARLWGVNHLAFAPAGWRWAAVALLVLAFIPSAARPVYRSLLRVSSRLAGAASSPAGIITVGAIAVASIAGFYALRSATLLLGDGQLIVRSFEAAEEGHDRVVMRSTRAIVTEEVIAPGTTLLYYGASKAATRVFHRTPLDGMRVFNCVLGGALVLVLGLVAAARSMSAEQRLWLVGAGLFSCSIELFFGYIENYTAPFFLLFLYVVTAFRALHNRGPLWLPALPVLAASYAHVQSVLFLPSFVYLVLWKLARKRRAALLRFWVPAFSCVAMIGVVAATAFPQLRRFYVPFGFDNESYGLLAPEHLGDVANEIMMLLPILPLVAALRWETWRAERASGRDPARDAKAVKDPADWFTHPAEWQFVLTILVPCGLYVLLFRPEIGMARDWDLFTMATLAIVPALLLLIDRHARATQLPANAAARFAVPGLAVLVVAGASWVSVNASVDRTADRFERILTYDHSDAAYAWENLAMMEHDRGKLERAIEVMRTASDASHNPRQYVRLAVYLEEAGRMDEGIALLESVLAKRPDYTKARFRLVLFLEKRGDWVKMLDVARGGVEYSPEESIYGFFYGESLMRAGRTDEGLEVFRSVRNKDLPPAAKRWVEQTLKKYGRDQP